MQRGDAELARDREQALRQLPAMGLGLGPRADQEAEFARLVDGRARPLGLRACGFS
jgi:hypothetical protein